MTHGTKPFRMVVAEHYIETGETITSKDVARDFVVTQMKANVAFKGIWHSGKYTCEKIDTVSPYKMRILGIDDTRGKKTYTDSSKPKRKKQKVGKKSNTELERLKRSFCGLRG